MTGPHESVLGREIEPVLGRFLDGMPRRYEIASGDNRLSAALVEFTAAGQATGIEWLQLKA
jgi:calcineurin-like phosphoesterase